MRILIAYITFSLGWVLLMDVLLLDRFNGAPEWPSYALGSDLLFIALSGLLLYMLTKLESKRRQRIESQLRDVTSRARCLLFEADVRLVNAGETLHWQWNIAYEEAMQRILPLNVAPGATYRDAWFGCRHPEDT